MPIFPIVTKPYPSTGCLFKRLPCGACGPDGDRLPFIHPSNSHVHAYGAPRPLAQTGHNIEGLEKEIMPMLKEVTA